MVRTLALSLVAITIACSPSNAAIPPTPIPTLPAETPKSAPSASTITQRFEIVVVSRPSGFSSITIQPDGTHEETLEIVQNGRGPKVKMRTTYGADGTIATFAATGKNEMGTTVDETFTLTDGSAKWKGIEENGDAKVSAPAFYVPRAPNIDSFIELVKALERAGGKIPLLPSGEARLSKTVDATAKGKAGERHVQGWEVSGLDLTPQRFWRNDDGTFFGFADAWFAAVPAGFEEAIDGLVEKHRGYERTRDAALAKKLAHPAPAAGLAFVHARVLDVKKRAWLPDRTVVIKEGKIASIGNGKPPAGAEAIDLAGKALLPGMWDMHAHLGPSDGILDLASGVTTARDLGNDPDQLDDYKKRFDDGSAIGPRVLRAGFIEGRGPQAAASKVTAETEAEAIAAVEFYKKRNYDQIKIYNSMKKELVPILAKAAHDKKMRVSGHVPAFMRARDCINAGYDEIQHVNMLFLNFFVDDDTDTRSPLRFSLVAEKAADFDFNGEPFKQFLALMKQKKTVIDPTLNAFENLFVDRQGELSPGVLPIAHRLPPVVRRHYLSGGLPVPPGKDAHYKASFAAALKMVKTLYAAGVPVLVGTDSLAGLYFHRELELHVMAGLTPGEVLENATLGSARVMGRDKTTGSIEVGKDADLFVVDGDPLKTVADIRRVVTVVRGGTMYSSAELYRAVSVAPWN